MKWCFKMYTLVAVVVALCMPGVARGAKIADFKGLVAVFLDIIDVLVLFVFGITLLAFLWGMTRSWILGAGDAEQIKKGKSIALTSVVVMVVMASVWGILALLRATLFA